MWNRVSCCKAQPEISCTLTHEILFTKTLVVVFLNAFSTLLQLDGLVIAGNRWTDMNIEI